MGLKGDDSQKKGYNGCNCCDQVVHTVEEIHGIGDAHDPDHGENGIEGIAPPLGHREQMQDYVVPYHEQDEKDLYEELDLAGRPFQSSIKLTRAMTAPQKSTTTICFSRIMLAKSSALEAIMMASPPEEGCCFHESFFRREYPWH